MGNFRTLKPAAMIEFKIEPCTTVRCKPEHAQTIREEMVKAVNTKYRAPAKASGYKYPKFKPGMTTAEYLTLYNILNLNRINIEYNCPNIDKPAPMLNPMSLEVIEEPNDD